LKLGSLLGAAAVACLSLSCSSPDRIVIASKNFTEQVILGELLAQHLENQTGLEVDRRLNLAGTFICHEGLINGQIDLYVEYTGTALAAILEEAPLNDSEAVLSRVREVYREQFAVEWTESLGFDNTFVILVRGSDARELGLETISDAAPHTAGWTAGFGYEFTEREDGYRGLRDAYGLAFPDSPREMELGLIYRALADGQVDLIAGNQTDGLIDVLDFRALEDDLRYFPPYDAVPLVRLETLEQHPEIRDALRLLGGVISEEEMRQMNYRVDGMQDDVSIVVAQFLASEGL
jgi:glycine betaine/choline ABC-type transport system substrate-binding protein